MQSRRIVRRPGLFPGSTVAFRRRSWITQPVQLLISGSEVGPECVRYLNRLSDLLFILSRAANAGSGEPLWEPGRYR